MLQAFSLPCIMLFPNGSIRRINAFHIYNSLKGCNITETGNACLFPKNLQNERISLKEFFHLSQAFSLAFFYGQAFALMLQALSLNYPHAFTIFL